MTIDGNKLKKTSTTASQSRLKNQNFPYQANRCHHITRDSIGPRNTLHDIIKQMSMRLGSMYQLQFML